MKCSYKTIKKTNTSTKDFLNIRSPNELKVLKNPEICT